MGTVDDLSKKIDCLIGGIACERLKKGFEVNLTDVIGDLYILSQETDNWRERSRCRLAIRLLLNRLN